MRVIKQLDALAADARRELKLGNDARADAILQQRLAIIKPTDDPNVPLWLSYAGVRTVVTRAEAKAIVWIHRRYIVGDTPKRSTFCPRVHTYALKNLKRRLAQRGVNRDMLPFDNEDFVGLLRWQGVLTPYPPPM